MLENLMSVFVGPIEKVSIGSVNGKPLPDSMMTHSFKGRIANQLTKAR